MYELSGQVLDSNGFSVENATVSIAGIGKFALTDGQGFFNIHRVPPGSYYLVTEHRGYDQYISPIMISRDNPNILITMNTAQGIWTSSGTIKG